MADFISGFWDLYVAGIVAFGLLLCLVLLLANRTVQQSGAPQLKGHVWDENLREYNNPLPRWWLVLFLGTILFSIVYLVFYPGFGSRNSTPGDDTGLRREYARELDKAKDALANYRNMSVENLAALVNDKAAMETGQRLFLTYCAQCHGSQGKGSKGYPNLTDNDWLYGGDLATIKSVIEDGSVARNMNMLPMPSYSFLTDDEKVDVAHFVRSLSGLEVEDARLKRGEQIFKGEGDYASEKKLQGKMYCAQCHQPNGQGAPGLAPNLADNIWLFGDEVKDIVEGVHMGRNDHNDPKSLKSVMPAWKDFLSDSEAKINILAAYVYSLSQDKK